MSEGGGEEGRDKSSISLVSKEVQLPQGFSSAGNRLLAAVLIIRRCLSWSGDRVS